MRPLKSLAGGIFLLLGLSLAAQAASVEDFYKGRTINLYIGYSVGGAYDSYARQIARFLGTHIPGNPTVLPQNMDGAGSLRAANFLAVRAAKDGSAIATFARGAAFDPLLGQHGTMFDATKLNWLGSATTRPACASPGPPPASLPSTI